MTTPVPRWRRPGWLVLAALLMLVLGWTLWRSRGAAASVATDRPSSPSAALDGGPIDRAAGAGGVAGDSAPVAASPVARPAPAPTRLVPDTLRIVVEVLNATDIRGLARRATFYLRDRGFDVVASGGTRERRDSTLIVDRSARGMGALVAQAFPGARVETRADSSRYLDVTVLLGRDWAPPREPLYP